MKYRPQDLFHIETNRDFVWSDAPVTSEMRAAAASFGVEPVERAEVVAKRNPSSVVYCLSANSGRFVLRGVPAGQLAAMEEQCSIAQRVAFAGVLKPRRSREGTFAVVAGTRAWMCYAEARGTLFSGAECSVEHAVRRVLEFERALADLHPSLPGVELARLPSTTHRPAMWPSFFADLSSDQASPAMSRVKESLDAVSIELLHANRALLRDCVQELARFSPDGDKCLTHNDLQHANVLVYDGEPCFLDVEDICLESRAIAISHAVFKLLRQTVHARVHTTQQARNRMGAILGLLRSDHVGLDTPADLFRCGAYRIVSDIWEIADCSLSGGDDSQLYDLSKRVQNLFELHHLVT